MLLKHSEMMEVLNKWDKISSIELDKCTTSELEKLLDMKNSGKALSAKDIQFINNLSASLKERVSPTRRETFATSIHNTLTNKTNTMSRIDKIVAIKQSNADDIKTIRLHECNDNEITRLYSIVVNQTKGIPRSTSDWQFVDKMKRSPGNYQAIGKFS